MQLSLRSVAFKTGDRSDQVPLKVTLVREMAGPDRPDYWLGELEKPFDWITKSEGDFTITHLVLAAQYSDTGIHPGVNRLPVGIAYVTDMSLLDDEQIDFAKIRYVAHGVADDPTADRPSGSIVAKVTDAIASLFGK